MRLSTCSVQRASREPEIAQRRVGGGGVDVQLRHGNPRILLQDHNITAESIHQCCTTAENTLLLAPGPHRLTPIKACRHEGAVYTCFYSLDHQKTHFLMPWRRDHRLTQTPSVWTSLPCFSVCCTLLKVCFL